MVIKIGQVYKRKESEQQAMVVGIHNNQVYLGTGRSVSETTLDAHYILLKDVKD